MRRANAGEALVRTLALTASRRGQARVEALWIRSAGPLGLVWKQRKSPIDGMINIVPSLRAVTDEGSRLFPPNRRLRLRPQRLRGAVHEFEAFSQQTTGTDTRTNAWNPPP